jgi:hypothetical protein
MNPLDPGLAQQFNQSFGINVIDQHYFVNQNGSLVPVFDSTSSGPTNGDPNAIFFGTKIQHIPSPDGPDNVDWLQLQKVSGELANTIYRVHTFKGQPPATVSSSSTRAYLSRSTNVTFLCSAIPDLLISLFCIPHCIVRAHDVMISAWPLLTARV